MPPRTGLKPGTDKHKMYFNAKGRARDQGLPFTIKSSDIVVPNYCPILGIPIYSSKVKFTDHSPSLDRIRPELGYVIGNVQVISMRANILKNNATLRELQEVTKLANTNMKD
jgi:hypothetical protein